MAQVTTTPGTLAGVEEDGLHVFRGIPFARPPLGDLRWRAPQPVEPWSGVRSAAAFGPAAWQAPRANIASDSPFVGMFGAQELEMSEDCLTLNVWTPALDGSRPVMVWIHGGAFRTGTGANAMYDGAGLATRGDVVVVTLNYRLGALGYLYAEGLDANVGSLDQVAALEWVRDEIAAFGGDPSQVTVFGESAGAKSVETLLAMPAARGLFHRAIMQSTYDPEMEPAAVSETTAELVDQLGASLDPAALRAIDASEVIAAQTALQLAAASGQRPARGTNPVIDGTTVPRHPLEAIAAGEVADVPVLIGSNLDESKLFAIYQANGLQDIDEDQLIQRLRVGIPDAARAHAAVSAYRQARAARNAATSAIETLMAINSDRMFRYHSTRVAEEQARHQPRTYMYLLTYQAELFNVGACHALDLPFVFGTFDTPLGTIAGASAAALRLSEQMQDAWLAFAKTGDPSHEGLPGWPAYEAGERATMILDAESHVERAPLEAERRFWQQ